MNLTFIFFVFNNNFSAAQMIIMSADHYIFRAVFARYHSYYIIYRIGLAGIYASPREWLKIIIITDWFKPNFMKLIRDKFTGFINTLRAKPPAFQFFGSEILNDFLHSYFGFFANRN